MNTKNKQMHRLYRIGCLLLLTAAATVLHVGCDSNKAKASLKVLKRKTEDKLVDIAGKGQVALQMHRDRHAQLKVSHMRMVAQEKILRRKISEINTRIEKSFALDEGSRTQLQGLSEVYENALPKILTAQQEGVAALGRSKIAYEKLKIKVEVIEAQIDLNKNLINAQTSFDVEETSHEVNQLIDELNNELALAEAAYEVEALNLSIH